MAAAPASKSVKICLSLVPFVLLLIAGILAFVGYFGVWGSASFNFAALVQGKGDFTLRTITVSSSILGFKLPPETYEIDDTLCGNIFSTPELDEVCQKFTVMRVFSTLTLIFTLVAFAFTILSFFTAHPRMGSRLLAIAIPIASLLLMVATATFAIVALAVAASLPTSPKGFKLEHAAGAGSICTAIVAALCLIAAGFELLNCRKGVHASRHSERDESSWKMKEAGRGAPPKNTEMFEPGPEPGNEGAVIV